MNKKKILCLLLSVCFVFQAFVFTAYASLTKDSQAIELLTQLKIINPPQSEYITKAEFTANVVNLLGYTEGISLDYTLPYKDTYQGHKYSMQLKYAYNIGLFDDSWEYLYPDDNVTLYFASTVAMNALGYKILANSSKYISVYNDVTAGITVGENGVISAEDAAKIIYNMLFTDIVNEESFTADSVSMILDSSCILEKHKNLELVEGRVNATGKAAISGIKCADSKIKIGSKLYNVNADYTDYVGYDVYAFADKDTGFVKGIVKTGHNAELFIDAYDFCDNSFSEIEYYDNNKKKTAKLDNPTIIYNGCMLGASDYSSDIFDNLEIGSVKLISANKSKNYDVVVVESYTGMFVGSVDLEDNVIISREDSTVKAEFSNCDDPEVYKVSKGTVSKASLEVIGFGDFVRTCVSKDGSSAKIYVYTDKVFSSVVELSEKGSYIVVEKGVRYNVDKCIENLSKKIDFAGYYELALDENSNVIGLKSAAGGANEYLYGFIIDIDNGGSLKKEVKAKMLTAVSTDSKGVEILHINKKVALDGKSVEADTVKDTLINANGGELKIPCVYKLNTDGNIYYIDTPCYEPLYEDENTLIRRKYSSKFATKIFVTKPSEYKNVLGQQYLVPKGALIALVPADEDNIVRIEQIPERTTNDSNALYSSDVIPYTLGQNTSITPIVVWKDNYSETASDAYNSVLYIVKKLSTVAGDDGDVRMLEVYDGTANYTYPITDDVDIPDIKNVCVGDIVMIALNNFGEINGISIIGSVQNPGGENKVTIPKVASAGNIAYMNNTFRVVTATVKSVFYDELTNANYMCYFIDGQDDVESVHIISGASRLKLERDEVVIEPLSLSSIKTYEDYGTDADRVIIRYQYSKPLLQYFIGK